MTSRLRLTFPAGTSTSSDEATKFPIKVISTRPLPRKYRWIKQGVPMIIGSQSWIAYSQCSPYWEGNKWKVTIKWESRVNTEEVVCSQCVSIMNNRAKRIRRPPKKFPIEQGLLSELQHAGHKCVTRTRKAKVKAHTVKVLEKVRHDARQKQSLRLPARKVRSAKTDPSESNSNSTATLFSNDANASFELCSLMDSGEEAFVNYAKATHSLSSTDDLSFHSNKHASLSGEETRPKNCKACLSVSSVSSIETTKVATEPQVFAITIDAPTLSGSQSAHTTITLNEDEFETATSRSKRSRPRMSGEENNHFEKCDMWLSFQVADDDRQSDKDGCGLVARKPVRANKKFVDHGATYFPGDPPPELSSVHGRYIKTKEGYFKINMSLSSMINEPRNGKCANIQFRCNYKAGKPVLAWAVIKDISVDEEVLVEYNSK